MAPSQKQSKIVLNETRSKIRLLQVKLTAFSRGIRKSGGKVDGPWRSHVQLWLMRSKKGTWELCKLPHCWGIVGSFMVVCGIMRKTYLVFTPVLGFRNHWNFLSDGMPFVTHNLLFWQWVYAGDMVLGGPTNGFFFLNLHSIFSLPLSPLIPPQQSPPCCPCPWICFFFAQPPTP